MTEHPLTDEICLEITNRPYIIDTRKDDLRAAADWQLKQVMQWLDENVIYYDYLGDCQPMHMLEGDLKKAMRPLICEDCGKQDETVRNDNCPYAEGVCDVIQPIVICPDCYHQRGMDV